MKKFNHLNIPDGWKQYWSRYPQGYTIIEALINWVSQVDDMVDNQNTLTDNVRQFRSELDTFIAQFDTSLQSTITDTLSDWQSSGFLDVVINQALDTKYHEMDDRLSSQLTLKANRIDVYLKSKGININDFDEVTRQAILEAQEIDINYVLGKENVTRENISKKAVTPIKTTFAIGGGGVNLFDGNFVNFALTGSSTFAFTSGETFVSAIIKVEPNKTYRILKSLDTTTFRAGVFDKYPEPGDTTTIRFEQNNAETGTINTGATGQYMVVYVSNDNIEPVHLMVSEGEELRGYISPNEKIVIDLDEESIPDISPEKTTFAKRGRNLFNGDFDNRYIRSDGSWFSDSNARTTKRMECKPNVYYTVSGGDRNVFRFDDADGDYITHIEAPTAQSPSNAAYMYVFYSSNGTHDKVQVEEGEVATEYVPYEAVTIKLDPASFPKILDPVPNFIITDDARGNYTSSGDHYTLSSLDSNVMNLYAIYDELVDLYPDYVFKTLLGNEETTGLPIYLYEFIPPIPKSVTDFENPKILYVSGIHGHEKRVMLDGARFFTDLANNWRNNEILNMLRWNIHFMVIPSLNPYGFNNNQRKNGNGVDINRNFPNGWKPSDDPESNYYSGVAPLTEVESQIIDTLIEDNKDIIFAVDHHNYNAYPTSSSHVIWMDSLNLNTRKMLIGTANYLNSKVKAEYPFVEQENNSITAIIRYNPTGMHYQYYHDKGIPGVILETVTHMGGTDEDTQRFGSDVVGNLILGAVRYHNIIKVT